MRALILGFQATAFFLAVSLDSCAQVPNAAGKTEAEIRFNLLILPNVRNAQERLNTPTQGHFERSSLRDILGQIDQRYGVRCWIDRRVDADKPLTGSMNDMTLGECFARLANLCDAEMGLIENIVCIAPADKLAAMQYTAVRFHDLLSRNSSGDKRAQFRPLAWPKLTTPTELLEQICKTWEIELAGELPHDLMNQGQLQPCTLATQLTLLLGGFDRCAVGNELTKLRIANLPKSAAWQTVYEAAIIPNQNVASAAKEFPSTKITPDRKQITVVGSTAAHLRLLRPIATERSITNRPRTNGRPDTKNRDPVLSQNYTVTLKQPQPIRSVLSAFVQQADLGLEIQWDKALSELQMQAQVTLDVKEAKIDQVLESLAKQSKLKIIRIGSVIHVGAM